MSSKLTAPMAPVEVDVHAGVAISRPPSVWRWCSRLSWARLWFCRGHTQVVVSEQVGRREHGPLVLAPGRVWRGREGTPQEAGAGDPELSAGKVLPGCIFLTGPCGGFPLSLEL